MRKLLNNPYIQFILFALALASIPALTNIGVLSKNYIIVFAGVIIYGIAALGLNVLLGYSGLISLGTAGFMGLGAYLSAYFTGKMNMPFELSLVLSILIPTILGILVGLVSLKIDGLYLAIATLAVSEIFREIFIQFDAFTGGASGAQSSYPSLLFGKLKLTRSGTYYLIVVILLVVLVLVYNFLKGYVGRALNAMRGSEHAAAAMGVNIFMYRLVSFALATALAATAGVLYVHIIRVSVPNSWTLNTSLDILAVIVIGGFRSIYGTFFGAFFVYGVSELFLKQISWMAEFAYIIKGVLIILVVMYYPGGSVQMFNQIKNWILKIFNKAKKGEIIDE
ncbi:MAG: branched-chain amino acid ABC transporter permease [Erysipelothrix sp.]|nr:branched-chain amino acid ABC transporter permease [Erysipelothrix sp.]